MSLSTTCPYCNSVVPLSEEQVASAQRVPCPRCGEAVPATLAIDEYAGPNAVTTASPSTATRRKRSRLVGYGVMIAMFALAGIVTVLVMNTRNKRRLTTLAETQALAYLPDDSNVIASLNYVEANRTPEGKEVMDRAGFDLERFSGLKREQIEAAVIGLRIDDNVLPRMRFVIRARSDIDLAAVRAKLDARSPKKEHDREYFPFQVRFGFPTFEFALWAPDSRTLVAVYPADELNKVPATPNENPDRFAAPVAELLKARAERDSFLWLIAHSDNWPGTGLSKVLPFLPVSPDIFEKSGQVRTIGLALRKDTGITATRARPARITQATEQDPHAVWFDLVMIMKPDADFPVLIDGLEGWADRQKLVLRDANRTENRYSATFVGTPEDWSRALESVMKKK